MATFSSDAYLAAASFPKHNRDAAHYGVEGADDVVLSSAIGPWIPGTTVDVVLAGLYDAFMSLAVGNACVLGFTANAWIAPWLTANAVIWKADAATATFTTNARLASGSSMTADAWLFKTFALTADAVIVENVC